jgi:hypothetical protein
MHSRTTDRRSASKCQGKWPDQTLDQALGLPEVLVAVSTSRLSCKRAGKTRTLMPVWDASGESRFKTADRLLKAAKAKHRDIAWAIASDAGVRLMRKDSELAQRIMFETVPAIGMVQLAVYDSFIVPANQKGRLMETMESAISCGHNQPKNPCGDSPQIRDKLSPSSFSVSLKNDPTIWDGSGGLGGRRLGVEPAEPLSPTALVLELVVKLPTELRMVALGLQP